MTVRADPTKPTPSGAADADVAELSSQLRMAIARLSRRFRQEAVLDGEELTASTHGALATIERLGPVALGELAAVEHVQPPSMTRIVGRLEDLGYVSRVTDPGDRRVTRADITPEGSAVLLRIRTRRDAFVVHQLGQLSPSERDLLRHTLPLLERLQGDAP